VAVKTNERSDMLQQNLQQKQTPQFEHYHITSVHYRGASSVIPGTLNLGYPDGEAAYFRPQDAHTSELVASLALGEACVAKVTPTRVIFSLLVEGGEYISGNPIFGQYVKKPGTKPAA
jgi:hypothetical protein